MGQDTACALVLQPGDSMGAGRTMERAQAPGVLTQALRDGEEQLPRAVAQRADEERGVAQVARIRLMRHLRTRAFLSPACTPASLQAAGATHGSRRPRAAPQAAWLQAAHHSIGLSSLQPAQDARAVQRVRIAAPGF